MQGSFYAELQPIKNLRIKSQFGYIMGASSYRSYLPRFDYLSASLNNAEDKVTQSMSMYNVGHGTIQPTTSSISMTTTSTSW